MLIVSFKIQSYITSYIINKNKYQPLLSMLFTPTAKLQSVLLMQSSFLIPFNINRVFILLPSLNSAWSHSCSPKGNYRLQRNLEKYLCFNTSCMSSRIPPEMTLLLFNGKSWSHGRWCFYYNQLQRTGEGELICSWVCLNFCTFQYLSVSSENSLQEGCVRELGFLQMLRS